MGVNEDMESHINEDDLFFEGGDAEAKGPAKQARYICYVAPLLGFLAALASVSGPTRLTAWPGLHRVVGIDSGLPACGSGGACPLSALFADPEVHQLVAESLVQAGSPPLEEADLALVRGLVAGSFRNISSSIERNAPAVFHELTLLKINATVKRYIIEAMQLVTNQQVQGFGKHVSMAIRASSTKFTHPEDLEHAIVKNLWHQLAEIQRFQIEEVGWATRSIWAWGSSNQWEMTFDVEAMSWIEAISGKASSLQPLTATNVDDNLVAVSGGAIAQGRTLLDLMIMCIRSKGPSWDTNLRGAVSFFLGPLATPCEPELIVGRSADFTRALICPLKFGMLGVDALRFTATLTGRPEQAGCERPGICPLRGLFFDEDVHKTVAKSLIGLGIPLLGPADEQAVRLLVGQSFRNISSALHKHAPSVGDELNELTVNLTMKGFLLQAMELTRDPQVQDIGRVVSRAMKVGLSFIESSRLKGHLAQSLMRELGDIHKLQEEIIPWSLRQIWLWGEDRQWEMAMAVQGAESVQLIDVDGSAGDTPSSLSDRDTAVVGGALEEGRALLDIMLMCIRSKGPTWSTGLGGVVDLFSGPLSTQCEPLDALDLAPPDFRTAVICPLKFGMLGLDALRYAASRFKPKEDKDGTVCIEKGVCPLQELFFDEHVQERVAQDIIGAGADPFTLLGRTELPLVREAVAAAFGNISATIQKHAPALSKELSGLTVNATVKGYILEALQLMTDSHIQEIGRHVARVLRSGGAFASPEELRTEIVRGLWKIFADIQKLQAQVTQWPIRAIWAWADDHQWEMTFDMERGQAGMQDASSFDGPPLAMETAVMQAAWEEGRALLDLMLMCIRSKGPGWTTSLGGAKGVLAAALRVACDPDVELEGSSNRADFRSGLVCPLKFGILGMDALRFTDSVFAWTHVDQRSCKERGMCPLSRFFFDEYVHTAAAADVLKLAAAEVDWRNVEEAVELTFRNISVHVHMYARGVAENLDAIQADETEKEHFVAAMQLTSDPKVQAFGRDVARAVKAANGFRNPAELKLQIQGYLGIERIEAMRNFSLATVSQPVLQVWNWGKEDQWTITTDAENINSIKMAHAGTPGTAVPAIESTAEQVAAIRGAVLEEGRVLLDLMLMHIRKLQSHLSTSLFGAMDVFSSPLGFPCTLEEPAADAHSLRETLFCPMKFGALGVDGLRFAATTEPPQHRTGLLAR